MPLYIILKITKPRQYFGTRSGFYQVTVSRFGIRSRIQEGKNTQKYLKHKTFHGFRCFFWNTYSTFINCFLIYWVIFYPTGSRYGSRDPTESGSNPNPDPIRIRIQSESGSTTMKFSAVNFSIFGHQNPSSALYLNQDEDWYSVKNAGSGSWINESAS